MSGFRWIQMSLFLMLLHLTAITGQYSPYFVRDGDEVTLPCENVIDGRQKCDYTTWIFSGSTRSPAVELVSFGQIVKNAKTKSDRLSVTATCSLVIKKVTVEDVGYYNCREIKAILWQTDVYLSVINMSEHKDDEKVTLSCSVLAPGRCRHKVKWLYEGKDVDKDSKDMKTSQSDCSVTLTFSTTYLKLKSKYHELFKCDVTDGYTGKVQLFPFSAQSSGEPAPTTTMTSTKQEGNQRPPDDDTVFNSVRSRTVKRSGAAASQLHHDGDGHDGTVNYENASASVRLH